MSKSKICIKWPCLNVPEYGSTLCKEHTDVVVEPRKRLYYLQDCRGYVGNSMLWWGKNHSGYVCDIRKAHVFTEDEIGRYDKDHFRAWRKDYIDAKISHHIDMQHVEQDDGAYSRREAPQHE